MTTITTPLLLDWRSLLFVPAHVQRFIESAPKRGADAIILDLEDSVPSEVKPSARQQLATHLKLLDEQSQAILVRINADVINAVADIEVAVTQYTQALILPKVMGAEHIRLLDEAVTTLENMRGIPAGNIRFIAMIETMEGLDNVKAIAQACSRMAGLALGTEDLSLSGGFDATPENLMYPAQQLIYAARLANINAYGFPGSIADYSDMALFTQYQEKAKSMGFNGALCIHPLQVEPVNRTYAISSEELAQAQRIIQAYEEAIEQGRGAVEVDGKMVDAPVVERALKIKQRASR
ncbi:MAG: HpcH/HpaI aldolase/citrate lyase family protein [Cellvibrionaceae bacterium]